MTQPDHNALLLERFFKAHPEWLERSITVETIENGKTVNLRCLPKSGIVALCNWVIRSGEGSPSKAAKLKAKVLEWGN